MNELKTRIQLKRDTSQNWNAVSASFQLRPGEVGFETDTGYLKIGIPGEGALSAEGKLWKDTPYIKLNDLNQVDGLSSMLSSIRQEAIDASKTTVVVSTDVDISEIADGNNTGDIAILKKSIAKPDEGEASLFEYTAYVWNAEISDWCQMDGNYSADNVYFNSDVTFAGNYTLGNKKTTNAQTYVVPKGTSLASMMSDVFTKELSGSASAQPYVSGTTLKAKVNGAGSLVTASQKYEVGTFLTDVQFSGASFTKGTYSYGPVSQQEVTSWTTTSNAAVTSGSDAVTGAIESICLGDSGVDADNDVLKDYSTFSSLTATTAAHTATDTVEAYTNLKPRTNSDAGFAKVQFAAATLSKASGSFTCARKCFWGYRLTTDEQIDTDNMSSSQVRSLQNSDWSLPETTSDKKTTNFTVPAHTKQIFLCAPAGTKTKKICAFNNSSLGAKLDFDNGNARKQEIVEVEGANGYTAKKYDVWYVSFGAELAVNTELAITWE